MDRPTSFIEFNVIYQDEHMFEVRIIASNGPFKGTTEIYDNETLLDFARELSSFPTIKKELFCEMGEKDGYSYFSMKLNRLEGTSHFVARVTLEQNVREQYNPKDKCKITLNIPIEISAVDNFKNELTHLATDQEGTAMLVGLSV